MNKLKLFHEHLKISPAEKIVPYFQINYLFLTLKNCAFIINFNVARGLFLISIIFFYSSLQKFKICPSHNP